MRVFGYVFVFALAMTNGFTSSFAADRFTAHVEDDQHQFVDLYARNGTIVLKVSNGRKFRPMHVRVTANFFSGDHLVETRYYQVSCKAPDFFEGKEAWFVYAGVPSTVTRAEIHSSRDKAIVRPPSGWQPTIPIPLPDYLNGLVPEDATINAQAATQPAEARSLIPRIERPETY